MMAFLKTAVPGFTTILFRKKRTRILVALALLPWVVVSIVKIVGGLSPSLSLTSGSRRSFRAAICFWLPARP